MLRTAIEDLRFHTLSAIPSMFGKLVYVSNLRSIETGSYQHYGLAVVFGEKDAENALELSHQELFQEWLACGMKEQKRDLDLYLSSQDDWFKKTEFKELLPQTCKAPEKQMFTEDLKQVLEIIKTERARQ